MNSKGLHAADISHSYGDSPVLDGIQLRVTAGEFVAVVGASGCGKSTLLNILSGHLSPSSGTVSRNGQMRMVHQRDGVFPWMTVSQNVVMALRHISHPAERDKELKRVLELVRLAPFADEYPHRLSVGMRQRVELARAIASETEIMLLDEPFSALDYLSRHRLGGELAGWLSERPRAVILVTHDLEEAARLADRIIVLSGRPAGILDEITFDTPSPRDPTDPIVVDAVRRLLRHLQGDTALS
jgi:NitT/TauT family transport system ATP-binding protein